MNVCLSVASCSYDVKNVSCKNNRYQIPAYGNQKLAVCLEQYEVVHQIMNTQKFGFVYCSTLSGTFHNMLL